MRSQPRMRPPDGAEPGSVLDHVDTPALLVDLDVLDANIATMASFAAETGVSLRPHAKAHKCAEVARKQIAAGAVGICCQKLSEAEALVAAGLDDVLVTNELVGPAKIRRLVELARHATVAACVDDPRNVAELAAAAHGGDVVLALLVEVDIGDGRCGAPPGEAVVALADTIESSPGLRFAGLHAYRGGIQHVRSAAERRDAAHAADERARIAREALAARGIRCDRVTGGGTGTFPFDAELGVHDEIQPGSYVFMDADYARNEPASTAPAFAQSLFVWSTVMSAPSSDRVVLDAGTKSLPPDSGPPTIPGWPNLEYRSAGDEHGVVVVPPGSAAPSLGEKLALVPGHCDPTVNLYDWLVCVRDRVVVDVWPVVGRGASY
jgi:D-serine deaminase-like pyridoxal phosphate-dependent protein